MDRFFFLKYFFDNNILNLYIDLKVRPIGLFLYFYKR